MFYIILICRVVPNWYKWRRIVNQFTKLVLFQIVVIVVSVTVFYLTSSGHVKTLSDIIITCIPLGFSMGFATITIITNTFSGSPIRNSWILATSTLCPLIVFIGMYLILHKLSGDVSGATVIYVVASGIAILILLAIIGKSRALSPVPTVPFA